MTTAWMRGVLAIGLLGLAAAGPAGATEESGSGRAGFCGAMGFRSLGVDDAGDKFTLDGTVDEVVADVLTVDLELPCQGPVVATFYAQSARTSGTNPSSIFLSAECVAPAVPGGCSVGTVTRSEPRGTNEGGPNSPFFQLNGQNAGTASVLGLFPGLPRGHYTFLVRAKVLIGGILNINDRALVIQAYGTPPFPASR